MCVCVCVCAYVCVFTFLCTSRKLEVAQTLYAHLSSPPHTHAHCFFFPLSFLTGSSPFNCPASNAEFSAPTCAHEHAQTQNQTMENRSEQIGAC